MEEAKLSLILGGVKFILSSIGAFISIKLGILLPVMLGLTLVMLADYATGMMASVIQKRINPCDYNKGLNSKIGTIGIFKKVGYLFAVGVGICLDWLIITMSSIVSVTISTPTFFGLLIAIWFILNELISILENLDRMSVELPKWLKDWVKLLQKRIDEEACKSLTEQEQFEETKKVVELTDNLKTKCDEVAEEYINKNN
jgi:toxin secretion/phage lysis holin